MAAPEFPDPRTSGLEIRDNRELANNVLQVLLQARFSVSILAVTPYQMPVI